MVATIHVYSYLEYLQIRILTQVLGQIQASLLIFLRQENCIFRVTQISYSVPLFNSLTA